MEARNVLLPIPRVLRLSPSTSRKINSTVSGLIEKFAWIAGWRDSWVPWIPRGLSVLVMFKTILGRPDAVWRHF